MSRTPQHSSHQTPEPLYVIVFGYPPDKYSVAVEYFKQLGETTDPDPNTEISNCFKIGFKHPGEAMWAVRKNGEIVSGSWMVGVKWAVRHSITVVLGSKKSRLIILLSRIPPKQNMSSASRSLAQLRTCPRLMLVHHLIPYPWTLSWGLPARPTSIPVLVPHIAAALRQWAPRFDLHHPRPRFVSRGRGRGPNRRRVGNTSQRQRR
jgi:hypothetical protein